MLWTFQSRRTNHLSLNNHIVSSLELSMSTENKLKRKHGYKQKKLEACQKCNRKWITFF